MVVERRFRRSLAGRYGHMLNRAAGKRGWSWFLRRALKAVERASPRERDAAAPREAVSSS
jgi:hypothetical protein